MIGVAYDYSAGKPGAAAIKQSGALGAIRYCGFPGRTKSVTQGEFEDFRAHDLGMAFVFQNVTTDWRGGRAAGQRNGRLARDHTNAIGVPADTPIYMAVDADVVKFDEFGTMIEYLKGANDSLGGSAYTGVYGEADVIDRARDEGVVSYLWQTAAWSRGRRALNLNLFQKTGAVRVGGVDCDINEVLTQDWGQHNYQGDDMPTIDEIVNAIKTQVLAGDWRFDRNSNVIDMLRQASGASLSADSKLDILVTKVNAMMGTLSDDEAKIIGAIAQGNGELLAAVAAIKPGEPVTDLQVATLADKLNTQLGGQWQLNITRAQP